MLDEHADRIIQWSMAGMSARAIAERLDVSNSTVSRWLKRPGNASLLRDARQEAMQQAMRAATTAAVPAIATLLAAVQDDRAPWRDRTFAANSILRLLGMDRLAVAMDHQTAATLISAKETLAAKTSEMIARAQSAEVVTLRAIEQHTGTDG